ncbi:MAG: cation diffusion facilitator family transporter [Deltaproteobacteria bacterium]|nr:cation diffusion facilitator family transporter [Deltaproteobacteria bacterium]
MAAEGSSAQQTALAADREKRLVALSSVLAAVLLTSLKIVVGVTTGSLGILSEAAHSGLDLVAAVVTLWAVRVAGQPADREHTYGHGKYENLSALFETLLLLATCVWIFYEVVQRLFFSQVHVDASPWAFAIMAVSIVVDWSRSRALARVAKKYQSQALEADALHFSTDVWSSAVVIAGLGAVFLSERLGLPWLAKADAVAAAAVAGIVVWVSVRLGKKTIEDLLDAVPSDLPERVAAAARVLGVIDVRKVRLRRSGPEVFADVTLTVGRDTPFEKAHDIASEAEAAIRACVPGADVVVHTEPASSGQEGQLTAIRLLASRHGLGAHAIRLYQNGKRLSVELHLEVDERLMLGEAHDKVTAFERALHEELAGLDRVVSHIEPTGDVSAVRHPAPEDELPVRRALEHLCSESGLSFDPHEVKVQRVAGELAVSFHCAMDAQTSIAAAHQLTELMEKGLRERVPNLGRVTIHVEPPEDRLES